jgi:hypothetical protein
MMVLFVESVDGGQCLAVGRMGEAQERYPTPPGFVGVRREEASSDMECPLANEGA